MDRKAVLLIGNNINDSQTWQELLSEVVHYLFDSDGQVKEIGDPRRKPLPLFYEEILLRSPNLHNQSETNLRNFIANHIDEIKPNEIHRIIMRSGFRDIMTTNYEYSLERAIAKSDFDLTNLGYIKEKRYSVFRHNQVDQTKVWHIHGEQSNPGSIILGYEHYAGFLQQMRNYVVSGTDYSKEKNLKPLIKRIDKGDVNNHSWIDFFFTRDIHIFGLSLDTSEIDLWWLLSYRARQFLIEDKKRVTNEIYYYYPLHLKLVLKDRLELLEALKVKGICIPAKSTHKSEDKIVFYTEILNRIANGQTS